MWNVDKVADLNYNIGMKILPDAKIADQLWYKIGGTAKYLIECSFKEDIIDAFKYIKKEKVKKYFVVGLGSNLLFTDDFYDGVVVQISNTSGQINLIGKNIIEAFAGVELDQVIQFAFDHNLIGLEWAGGLPGTVGAAIRGNVGAFGSEIKDTFYSAEVLDVSSSKYQVVSIKKEKEEIVANTSRTSRPVASSQKPGADSNTLKNLIDSVNQDNKILAGLLRGCILENSNGSTILKAPSSFHVGKLGEQKNREVIERILGKPVAIEVKS